jgi:hypothetical protein
MKPFTTLVAVLTITSAAYAADLTLERIGVVDFTGQLAGTNISSVAWDGTNAYVADWRNSGSAGDVSIVAAADALTAPVYNQYGVRTANAFRGYFGLAINGQGQLAATIDVDGTAQGDHIQIFDAATGTLTTPAAGAGATTNPRGGPAWDSQYGGVAFTSPGSGRFRQIQADAAGTVIWDDASGPYNFDGAWGTSWKDTDIDSSGNIYSREGLQVIKFTRTGLDTLQSPFVPNDMVLTGAEFLPGDGDNTVGLNLEVIEDFDAIIWNDRSNGGGGQFAEDVIRATSLDGTPLTIDFANAASFFTNNAWFDFSYDPATQTLAAAEFSSNRVYIYQITPEPSALMLLGLGVACIIRRR